MSPHQHRILGINMDYLAASCAFHWPGPVFWCYWNLLMCSALLLRQLGICRCCHSYGLVSQREPTSWKSQLPRGLHLNISTDMMPEFHQGASRFETKAGASYALSVCPGQMQKNACTDWKRQKYAQLCFMTLNHYEVVWCVWCSSMCPRTFAHTYNQHFACKRLLHLWIRKTYICSLIMCINYTFQLSLFR